jgi:anaphase-promoting complex subunit 8
VLNGLSPLVRGVDGRAAEAMNSMDEEVRSGHGMALDEAPTGGSGMGKMVQRDGEMERWETGKYLLGKSYFDCKEYDRAAFALKGCQSYKSQFLRLYSKFLVHTHTLGKS